jgi:hypothetical protein
MLMASKETTPMPGGAHLAGRVVGIVEQAELDHRRHQPGVVHQRQAVGLQVVRPAQRFGALEAEQHLHRARLDLRREHLAPEAQVRGDHAAALRHAGNLGFLHVMAFRHGRFGEDLGCRHDALAADAADEDVGDVVRAHEVLVVLTMWIGMSRRGTCWIASGAQGWTQRPQPVQAWLSMLTKASSTSLPEGLTTLSRCVTWIAGQPTSMQLPQPVHLSSSTR